MPARKFTYDRKTGSVVESTPTEVLSVCDEISKSVEPYKKPLEFGLPRGSRRASLWPRYNTMLGVNPSQRKEAMKEAAKLGVPTEFNQDGDPYFTDRNHENRYIKAKKLYHRNASYGDVAPDNYVESTHAKKSFQHAIAERQAEVREQIREIETSLYGD